MQTQIPTAIRPDVFAGIMEEITPPAVYIAAEDKRERYFFYPGDEPGRRAPGGLSVNTPCIPYKVIRRCQVTPCIARQVSARTEEIPEGMIISGTQGHRPGFSKYWLASGPEANTLLAEYGNPADFAHCWGLIELLSDILTGMSYPQFAALQINDAIWPQWPDIPDTNRGVLDHLFEINKAIEEKEHPWFNWNLNNSDSIRRRDIYLEAIPQMVMATEAAQAFQTEVVRASNIAVTLPSTEPGYKRDFDARDRLYSLRTGVPLAINSLRQNSSDALETVVRGLSEKLQPQVAPQTDPGQFALMAAAVVQALKSEGLLTLPSAPAGEQTAESGAEKPKPAGKNGAEKPKPENKAS